MERTIDEGRGEQGRRGKERKGREGEGGKKEDGTAPLRKFTDPLLATP